MIITSPFFNTYSFHKAGKEDEGIVTLNMKDCIEGFTPPRFVIEEGDSISCIKNEAVNDFISESGKYLKFQLRYIDITGIPIMFINKTTHVVSQFYRVKNGFILLLPNFGVNSNNQTDYQKFMLGVFKIIDQLALLVKDRDAEVPEWANGYKFPKEISHENALIKLNNRKIQVLIQRILSTIYCAPKKMSTDSAAHKIVSLSHRRRNFALAVKKRIPTVTAPNIYILPASRSSFVYLTPNPANIF